MKIIFQNGGIAELTNVDKIEIYNPGERRILKEAISEYFFKELQHQLVGIKEDSDEHPSGKTSSYGSLSKCNMAQEGSQYARQTGMGHIPSEGRGTAVSQS